MRLRLSRPAARQLERALAYIDQHNPQGARHVRERIQAVMQLLVQQPFAGRVTARRGVRGILATPYPYAVTYSVETDEIIVLGVRHTARRPLA